MKYEISKELEKWTDRVLFDVKFKEDTTANLNKLSNILSKSMREFTIIAANSEALVYKIGRFFISKGILNSDITFIDGKVVESYIGDKNSTEWARKLYIDKFLEFQGNQCDKKWVLIPNMDFEISSSLAIYFITSFKRAGAVGVIFYSEGANNVAEVLVGECHLDGFYQFPKADYYKPRRRKLPPDEY